MKNYDTNSDEAALIYDTLMKHYPAEIKKIQMMQANEMTLNGYVSDKTNQELDRLMDRVVADNKKLGRT